MIIAYCRYETVTFSNYIIHFLVVLSFWFYALDFSVAQMDPTSTLLLRQTTRGSSEDAFDTSRYEIADPPARVQQPQEPVRKLQTPEAKKEQPASTQNDAGVPMQEPAESSPSAELTPLSPEPAMNLLDLAVAPTYMYHHAQSSYWYRDHFSSGAGLSVDLSVWVAPEMALSTGLLTSLGHSTSGSVTGDRNVAFQHDWFTAGLKFRNLYGPTAAPIYLLYGIEYAEYRVSVDKTETQRISSHSTGPRVFFELNRPQSAGVYSSVGVEFLPSLLHKEEATALDLQSGTSVKAFAVGLWLGRTYQLNSDHQVFWKLSHKAENIVFSGTANTVDPISGVAPENVSVTNSFTMFQFGFVWGD